MPQADLSDWDQVCEALFNPEYIVRVAMVGKYVELPDAYKSVNEALLHAGIQNRVKFRSTMSMQKRLKPKISLFCLRLTLSLYRVVLVSVEQKARCWRLSMRVSKVFHFRNLLGHAACGN